MLQANSFFELNNKDLYQNDPSNKSICAVQQSHTLDHEYSKHGQTCRKNYNFWRILISNFMISMIWSTFIPHNSFQKNCFATDRNDKGNTSTPFRVRPKPYAVLPTQRPIKVYTPPHQKKLNLLIDDLQKNGNFLNWLKVSWKIIFRNYLLRVHWPISRWKFLPQIFKCN